MSKYSENEKRAYWMGVGAGLSDGDPETMIDSRFGKGQDIKLCESAKNGYKFGKKNKSSAPFDKHKDKSGVSRFIFGRRK